MPRRLFTPRFVLTLPPRIQWVIDSITSPDKKEEVKEKQLEALKRLGHSGMVLDEYESEYPQPGPFAWTLNVASPEKVANEVIHPDDIDIHFSGQLW